MFCKYCGTQLSDDSLFCEKCGKRLGDSIQSTGRPAVSPPVNIPPINYQKNVDKGRFLASIKYNTAPAIVGIVLGMIFIIVGIALCSWASHLRFYDSLYQDKDLFFTVGIILIVSEIILLICNIVNLVLNNDIYCTAYENTVIGRGVPSRGSTTKINFDLKYDDIYTATAENKIVTISGKSGQYVVCAGNKGEAANIAGIIMGRIQTEEIAAGYPIGAHTTKALVKDKWICGNCRQINSHVVTRCISCGNPIGNSGEVKWISSESAGKNEWKCPGCGRVNQNYVGTCGCGTEKPKT